MDDNQWVDSDSDSDSSNPNVSCTASYPNDSYPSAYPYDFYPPACPNKFYPSSYGEDFCPSSEWECYEKDELQVTKKHLIFYHHCPGNLTGGGSSGSGPGTGGSKGGAKGAGASKDEGGQVDDTWYSIFPVETPELVYGRWEDEVIWNVEEIEDIPQPKILALDPNDENIVLCIPGNVTL